MLIRLLCAGGWTYMAVNGSPAALIPACWNLAPGLVALRNMRAASLLIVFSDLAVVGAALLALAQWGQLHGGEFLAFTAVPALPELVLAIVVLKTLPQPAGPGGASLKAPIGRVAAGRRS